MTGRELYKAIITHDYKLEFFSVEAYLLPHWYWHEQPNIVDFNVIREVRRSQTYM